MAMKNKQLKELLNQYPDDSLICIIDTDSYGDSERFISSVIISYVDNDDYSVPQINLK